MINFSAVQHRRSRFALRSLVCAISLGFGAAAGPALAQAPTAPSAAGNAVIYPAKGQSARQQGKDKYECYDWAKRQSGFDPMQQSQSVPVGQPNQSGMPPARLLRGAATDADAMAVAMRERARARQAARATQQQAAQQRATYDRAFGACMEARGYAVK